MEIFVFLIGLGCLVLIVWAIALFGKLVADRKYRRQNRPQRRSSSPPPESKQKIASEAPPLAAVQPSQVVALVQPPVSSRVRLPSNKHQQNIRRAERVLKRLREVSTVVQLPEALGILRKMNPYAFEELLLTCCHERDWQIERNFKYTGDGGLDGRVTIAGRLYLIQAKRYRGYINPKHIRDFHRVIERDKAVGGFFIHTGKTGEMSKELLREYRISLLSGERLVDFVLGLRLKILG
ncbi:restriction endonuclease [Chlorogloea sp. CCALA 695]|uniref:restriction endonuclease n=1 Tax=Chlorogloea sp. CCALA 695 TaxID=2107693 RepID=UPI000D073987|nr:restriction endonuclease [Chlorogloea sp. CCALA 695]PSB30102.1 restriction endonuclease [Chlorogloea sp. CCALA 695]